MIDVKTIEEMDEFIAQNELAFLYVSHPDCGVCKALLPKVKELLDQEFPKVQSAYVNTHEIPEVAGRLSIFTVPVLILFFEGKEVLRKARFVSMDELDQEISKIYRLVAE